MNLTEQKCVPCEVGGLPLTADEVSFYAKDVPEWKASADNKKISRVLKFKDFVAALAYVNKVGEVCEREGHHADMNIHYNQVTLELWTHAVGGLSVNDFIVAAKIGQIK